MWEKTVREEWERGIWEGRVVEECVGGACEMSAGRDSERHVGEGAVEKCGIGMWKGDVYSKLSEERGKGV